MFSKGGHDWTSRYPWIVETALKIRKSQFIIAGVRYIEVTPESGTEEMVRVISRIAQVERLKLNTSDAGGSVSCSAADIARPAR